MRKEGWLQLVILAGIWLAAWAAPSPAAYPPLREDNIGQVQVWTSASPITAHFKVYDPQRGAWKEGSASGNWTGVSMNVKDGVVYWWGNSADLSRDVGVALYDPGKGQWMIYQKNLGQVDPKVFDIQAGQGIVAFQYNFPSPIFPYGDDYEVDMLCYDPDLGKWESFNIFPMESLLPWFLTVKDGLVTWLYLSGGNVVELDYYAPHYNYMGGAVPGVWGMAGSNLMVIDGTVYYYFTFPYQGALIRGYDPAHGGWYDGNSVPQPDFFASTTFGKAPLWVWFWDRSFAWSSWNWSFGDGGHSTERSTYHVYKSAPPTPPYPFTYYGVQETISNGPSRSEAVMVYPSRALPFLGLLLN